MQRAKEALLLSLDQPYAHYATARLIMMKAETNDAASATGSSPRLKQRFAPIPVLPELIGR
jgi:hypothetical protein